MSFTGMHRGWKNDPSYFADDTQRSVVPIALVHN